MPLPSAGGAALRTSHIGIKFAYHGCAIRPFYHIVIADFFSDRDAQPHEQIGTYDPMPNADNQKLIGLNLERLEYWLGRGAQPSRNVAKMLGIMGLFPIHHATIKDAWINRRKLAEEKAKLEAAAADSFSSGATTSAPDSSSSSTN